eukprot:jgi/Picre1/33454/NNA_008778.t1
MELSRPLLKQSADIGVAIALAIPGATSATARYENGEIVIYVTLGTVRITLSRLLASDKVGDPESLRRQASGRFLLQTSANQKTRFAVLGTNKPEVERYQRELNRLLSNSTAISEISNSIVEGSTVEAEVEERVPKIACSYSGEFLISPLFSPCDKHYIAYVYPNCANTDVMIRTRNQLGGKPRRAVWQLLGAYLAPNTTLATSIRASERRRCSARFLQDREGTEMLVGNPQKDWIIRPAGRKDDCSKVNIYSVSKQAYLRVPRTCSSFEFASSDGGRQRFRLTEV